MTRAYKLDFTYEWDSPTTHLSSTNTTQDANQLSFLDIETDILEGWRRCFFCPVKLAV